MVQFFNSWSKIYIYLLYIFLINIGSGNSSDMLSQNFFKINSKTFKKIQLQVNFTRKSDSSAVAHSIARAHQESHCEVDDLVGQKLLILSAVHWSYVQCW